MHELSLVDECCRRCDGETVSLVRVRCSLPDLDAELQQAFLMMTTATPLEGAVLEVESATLVVACACGYVGPVHNGIVGHMFVCPECGQVGPIQSPGLELLEVRS
jgi:Zn finger protein HypA/HybF involved in hydrogenase expression